MGDEHQLTDEEREVAQLSDADRRWRARMQAEFAQTQAKVIGQWVDPVEAAAAAIAEHRAESDETLLSARLREVEIWLSHQPQSPPELLETVSAAIIALDGHHAPVLAPEHHEHLAAHDKATIEGFAPRDHET